MKLSGVVEVRDTAKLDNSGKAMKILCSHAAPNGRGEIWYILHSHNQRAFTSMKSLKPGDWLHFSGATMFNLKGFVDKTGKPGSTIEVDLSNSEVSFQRKIDNDTSKGIVDRETVDNSKVSNPKPNPEIENRVNEPVEQEKDAINFDFSNNKSEEELHILGGDWEGTDFGL